MPRHRRLNTPGNVYHLISRLVDRRWLIESDSERIAYLKLLSFALSDSSWRCLAFAVMSNHVHLVVEAGAEPLARWVRPVHSRFAQYMNAKHERIGSLFCRGPKDFLVPDDEVAKTIAYVHNNPVRAGVVGRARDSRWTSHHFYCGRATPPRWLAVSRGLERAGFTSAKKFDAYVSASRSERREADMRAFRRLVRNRGSIELATPTEGETISVPLVAKPWAVIRLDPRDVVSLVSEETGVEMIAMCSRRRDRSLVAARRIAVCAGIKLGLTATDVAIAVGITQQAASKLAKVPAPSEEVELIERVVARVAG